MTTTADLLQRRADDDHPALRFEDESWTWREFVEEAATRARYALEERRGDVPFHVGVLLENVPEYLFWIAGMAFAGGVVVGVNPTRRGSELAADVRHTDCQLVLTDRQHRPLLDGVDLGIPPERIVVVDEPAYGEALKATRGRGWPDGSPDPADALLLLFTSGSTGAPKAVVCSTGRLAMIGDRASEGFGLTRDDVFYQSMPLFHGNALMANWAPALAQGGTVALRRRFSASGFLPDVRRFGATYFNYVGRALAYILTVPEEPDDDDNPLRLGFGTEASWRDRERFSARFGCRLIESYGSSEGVIATDLPPEAPENSIGVPQAGMDVAVVDPDTGAECPPARFDANGNLVNAEAIGELVNRSGAGSFEGYYRNEEATQERLRDGWYWSGDLAYRDADGFLYFAGRSSDWLRVDSENFAAAPIERIIHRFPSVVMAAVFPVPDERTGDQVMVALELDDPGAFDADAFARFLEEQPDLGTKWAPRFVRLVESMPLTATNKVRKQPLRRDGWWASDPVYWRSDRRLAYRVLTADDRAEMTAAFETHGRSHLLLGAAPAASADS